MNLYVNLVSRACRTLTTTALSLTLGAWLSILSLPLSLATLAGTFLLRGLCHNTANRTCVIVAEHDFVVLSHA